VAYLEENADENVTYFDFWTHPNLMHLTYLLTCCFNFRFLLNSLCKLQTILSKQVLWTEAAFSACLTRHWPDHHWQWRWQVAWTSSHMCAGKRRTLQATIVTIFSHMTRDVSAFVKCDTIFILVFFGNYHNFILLTFTR